MSLNNENLNMFESDQYSQILPAPDQSFDDSRPALTQIPATSSVLQNNIPNRGHFSSSAAGAMANAMPVMNTDLFQSQDDEARGDKKFRVSGKLVRGGGGG